MGHPTLSKQETHRIFANERLHQLQVRYPWFCGYAAAPFAFAAGRNFALTGGFAPPLARAASAAVVGSASQLSAAMFVLHFARRAVEVVAVNDYTGTWARDSRLEIVYYALWGLAAGAASSPAALAVVGVAPSALRLAGAAAFTVGEFGNAWSHLELRRLRAERDALGTHAYVVPGRGPFAYVSSPHYTFELLSWCGYALHSALDPTSVALVAISAAAMSGFAADRHARYVALHQEGDRSNGDPSTRWRMIPFVW